MHQPERKHRHLCREQKGVYETLCIQRFSHAHALEKPVSKEDPSLLVGEYPVNHESFWWITVFPADKCKREETSFPLCGGSSPGKKPTQALCYQIESTAWRISPCFSVARQMSTRCAGSRTREDPHQFSALGRNSLMLPPPETARGIFFKMLPCYFSINREEKHQGPCLFDARANGRKTSLLPAICLWALPSPRPLLAIPSGSQMPPSHWLTRDASRAAPVPFHD